MANRLGDSVKHIVSLGLLVLVVSGQTAAAQTNPDSIKFRNDCRLYAQIIATGAPSLHAQEASIHILGCPEAGEALAQQLSGLRQSSDTAQLEAYLGRVQGLRDGGLFQAATTLAQDRGATTLARITALKVLLRQPGFLWGGELADFANANGGACALVKVSQTAETRGAPLPGNYIDAIQALVAQMANDSTDAVSVRNAAGCVRNYVRARLKYYRDWPPPLSW